MRAMIPSVARRLAVFRSVPAGTMSATEKEVPDPKGDVSARMRIRALRPEAVRAGDPDRQDPGPGPHGEEGEAVLRLAEAAGQAAGALGEDDEDMALGEDPLGQPERLDIGSGPVDRVDRDRADDPAEDRPLDHLTLAEPMDPPPEGRGQPATEEDAVGVGEVIRGHDEGSVTAGSSSRVPSTRTRVRQRSEVRATSIVAPMSGVMSSRTRFGSRRLAVRSSSPPQPPPPRPRRSGRGPRRRRPSARTCSRR